MAPVRHTPSLTTTRPPPARFASSMALRKAAVQSVLPSGFGAVAGDVEIPVREFRRLNSFQDLRVDCGPGVGGGPCAGTGEGGSRHSGEGMAACVGRHLNRWYGRVEPRQAENCLACAKRTVFGSSHPLLNYNLGGSHHAYPGKILRRRRGPFRAPSQGPVAGLRDGGGPRRHRHPRLEQIESRARHRRFGTRRACAPPPTRRCGNPAGSIPTTWTPITSTSAPWTALSTPAISTRST